MTFVGMVMHETGQHDRRNVIVFDHVSRLYADQPVDGPEVQLSRSRVFPGSHAHALRRQTVPRIIAPEYFFPRIEADQRAVGIQPQVAQVVLCDGLDGVVGQAFRRTEIFEMPGRPIQAAEPRIGACPDVAVPVLANRFDEIVGNTGRIIRVVGIMHGLP